METPNPYAAPLEPEKPSVVGFRLPSPLKAIAEGIVLGLLIALVDVNNLDQHGGIILMLLIAGGVLGFRHGFGGGALAWLPLGGLIFPTHLIAMMVFGYTQPYVERDPVSTILSLFALVPAGIGVTCGALVRLVWTFAGK